MQGVPGFVPRVLRDAGVSLFRAEDRVFDAMIDGWKAQMMARGLATQTIEGRCRVLRRFQEYAGTFPWTWRPVDLEDYMAERRSGEKPISLTTLRSDSNAIAMFCASQAHTWHLRVWPRGRAPGPYRRAACLPTLPGRQAQPRLQGLRRRGRALPRQPVLVVRARSSCRPAAHQPRHRCDGRRAGPGGRGIEVDEAVQLRSDLDPATTRHGLPQGSCRRTEHHPRETRRAARSRSHTQLRPRSVGRARRPAATR